MQHSIMHNNACNFPFAYTVLQDKIIIEISAEIINKLFDLAATTQQEYLRPTGFVLGKAPISYIKEFYKVPLLSHLKQFLLNYCILPLLIEQLYTLKISFIGEPKLLDIDISPNEPARFTFAISSVEPVSIQEWKYFSFKAPKRKNYKDLDKQVESFIRQECENLEKATDSSIALRDWVNFSVMILDHDQKPLSDQFSQQLWFKIGDEEMESPLRDELIGKKQGDSFITNNKGLQDYFSSLLQTHYLFKITVLDVLPDAYFDLELFKKYFRLKNNKDLHKKLIEVFSFRNDISQRRSTVEEILSLLISKHRVTAPASIITQQKNKLLRAMRENPDYTVYLRQRDFERHLNELSERQAREIMFIDQFAHAEDIKLSHEDIKGYLNLTKRNRMKDFLYFDIPESSCNGHEIPLSVAQLQQPCLREKSVNHAIYYLTKK